eukprot:g14345.t1
MAKDDGAIAGESESTDGLIEQYKRHRSEISKIPMYADSILKMLKDIRKTVRASSKLQSGPNAFAQFLEEWWASVVQFLQRSPIVEAEKNAREVMQTLKKLKGKQEENKKREISRLLSKLDDNAGRVPPTGRLSELLEPAPAQHVPPADKCTNPEDTSTRIGWGGSRLPLTSGTPQQQSLKRDRHSQSSEESDLSTLLSAVIVGDDDELSPGSERPELNRQQGERPRFQLHHLQQQQQQQQRVSFADERGHAEIIIAASRSSTSTSTGATASRGALSLLEGIGSAQAGAGNDNGGTNSARSRSSSSSSSNRPTLTLCVDDGDAVGSQSGVGVGSNRNSLRSPASCGLRSPGTPSLTLGVGGASMPNRVCWEEDSQGTAGTIDAADNVRVGVSFSGIPDSDDGEHEDEELFEAADNLDLDAVDLCATGTGADGQMTYRDQEELRLPAKAAGPPQKKGVEQERFSAALDFFRQEQHGKAKHLAFPLCSPPPMRTAASFSALPTPSSLRSPRANSSNAFTPKLGGSGAVRVRTPASRSRVDVKEGKTKARVKSAAARRRVSGDRGAMNAKDKLLSATKAASGRGQPLGRSLSVYVPSSRSQTTPPHRASKTPTVKPSRRALLSPGVRRFSRGAFFA